MQKVGAARGTESGRLELHMSFTCARAAGAREAAATADTAAAREGSHATAIAEVQRGGWVWDSCVVMQTYCLSPAHFSHASHLLHALLGSAAGAGRAACSVELQRSASSSDGWLGGRVLGSGHGVAEFSSLIAAQRAKSTYEGWTGFGAPLSLNVDAAPAAPQPSENFAYGGVAWSNVSYRSLARRQACHAAASSDPEMFGKLAQTRPGAASAQAPVHQYGQSRASTQPQHSQAQGVYTPGSDPFPPPPRMLHGVSWNTCKQAGQAFPMQKYACEQWQNCTLVMVNTLSMQQLIAMTLWRMDFTDTVRDAGAPRYIALRLAQAHNGVHSGGHAAKPVAHHAQPSCMMLCQCRATSCTYAELQYLAAHAAASTHGNVCCIV
ncbi:hypothetical protein HaLaN_02430 [Haematococcus lacustris]|uniref:Uncharacterized protein n=1 Tax=Haematococcus lacustris TaxID=44745 RepID=A0A699YL65_HAELA|nr:hypothetical protein HaLaN_02430 [Haematococcus lacustris]